MSEDNTKRYNRAGRRGIGPGGPMGGGRMMSGAKAKDFKGTMSKLLQYLGVYKISIIIVCIFAIISTVFTIIGPKILGKATDELFSGIMGQITGSGISVNFTRIGQILLTLLALYSISAIFSYVQGFIMSNVTTKVSYNLRRDINVKMHTLPFSYYDKTTHGEILSRVSNDVETISHTLSQSLSQIITSTTALIGTIVMMLTISWKLTLVAFIVIPLSLITVMFIVKKSQSYFRNQQKYLGNLNGHVEEMYGAHVIVKAFNGQKESNETFEKSNSALYKTGWKANFLSGLMMPITGFIGNIGYVIVCIFGGYLAVNGSISVGGIQSFIQYVRSFMQPISQVANISNILQQTVAAAERVFEFLDEKSEVSDVENALTVNRADEPDTQSNVHIEGIVDFDNVKFSYNEENTVIHNFSANLEKGQKVAIVGPTGAGKTTIVKLLMRFYDVNEGSIKIDGHDIRLFSRNELRSLFGMVLQDTWLFNGTISDNIKYGKLDATNEEVQNAAKAAQVHHFVRTLPDGYDMVLNEEVNNVSAGQKQLLTIARAILADPEILILDEATSSVDTRTEIMIQKAMDNLMKGRTSFIIAHRLSTIKNADLILVMREGDIVEQGTHEELLAACGFYKTLYDSQFDEAS